MTVIKAQVVIQKKSGLARDAITNTWHFDVGGSYLPADGLAIANALTTFYQAVDNYFHRSVSPTTDVHKIKLYNLGEYDTGNEVHGLAGPPVNQYNLTLVTGATATPNPAEVAAALTFEANSTLFSEEVGQTRPASRRRGRIFLGPLGSNALEEETNTSEVYLLPAFRTAVLTAAQSLQSGLAGAASPIAHSVLSKADGLSRDVTAYSMDDAPDTIRSRGVRPRTRSRVAGVVVALGA